MDIRKTYTRTRPVFMGDDCEIGFVVDLAVDQQSFCITPHGLDTQAEAEWYRDQLATALTRLVAQQSASAQQPGGEVRQAQPNVVKIGCPLCAVTHLVRGHQSDPPGTAAIVALCGACGAPDDVAYYDANGQEILPGWKQDATNPTP